MKATIAIALLFFSLFGFVASGGEAPKPPKIKNKQVGKWVNLHRKRADLLGVYVQQFPDNLHTASKYEGKHPAMVIYVFNSMKAHQLEYQPNGKVSAGFWWEIKPGNPILRRIRPVPNHGE